MKAAAGGSGGLALASANGGCNVPVMEEASWGQWAAEDGDGEGVVVKSTRYFFLCCACWEFGAKTRCRNRLVPRAWPRRAGWQAAVRWRFWKKTLRPEARQ